MPHAKSAKTYINVASGVIGCAIAMSFAWSIYHQHIPQNIATWGMGIVLDTLGVILVLKAGNKRPALQIGWCIASYCIFFATLVGNKVFHWSWVETTCLVLCFLSLVIWKLMDARTAVFVFAIAVSISLVPLIVDYWHEPQRSTWWVWVGTDFVCALAIYSAEPRDATHTLVQWCILFFNLILALLCFF